MPFSGLDDLIAEVTAGKTRRINATRIINTGGTSAAGRFHEGFAVAQGTGGIGVLTGTAGVGSVRDASSPGSLPLGPVSVAPDTRHLTSMMAVTPAATAIPGLVKLIDIMYVYPSCAVTTGAGTALNNTAPKPTRLGTGQGVRVGCAVVGALGAATPVITMTYVDQDGNAGNQGFLAAPAASLPVGTLLAGANIAVPGGPDMIMAQGDSGVRELTSYTVATGTAGSVSFFLYRDLAEVPLVAANLAGERDFIAQIPSLPQIEDNACLAPLILVGGALTANNPVLLSLNTAWG